MKPNNMKIVGKKNVDHQMGIIGPHRLRTHIHTRTLTNIVSTRD
jgi:hypothetical protein